MSRIISSFLWWVGGERLWLWLWGFEGGYLGGKVGKGQRGGIWDLG